MQAEIEIVSDDPEVQSRYEQALTAGQSRNFAEIIAFRSAPGGIVQGNSLRRAKMLGDSFKGEEHMLKRLQADARRKGITLHQHGEYCPGLADYPGDASAVITPLDPVGFVKHECDKKGLVSRGSVQHRGSTVSRREEKLLREGERKRKQEK